MFEKYFFPKILMSAKLRKKHKQKLANIIKHIASKFPAVFIHCVKCGG